MKIYLYFIQLLLIILGSFLALESNKKYSSNKIKLWYSISFSFIIMSFFMRFYMFVFSNLNNLYLFKHIYYLNYLGTIMGVLISIFVFLRSNRLKFDYVKFMFLCIVVIYMLFMHVNSIEIKLLGQYGYFMEFTTSYYEKLLKFFFNGLVISSAIYILKTQFKDKIGGVFILICGIMGLVIVILTNNYKSNIILETFLQLFWIITMNYSIYRLKK